LSRNKGENVSDLAEYARELHESESKACDESFEPVDYPAKSEKLYNIRAAICDVYGTLINYWKPGFGTKNERSETILQSFSIIIDKFGFREILSTLNNNDPPEKTLSDFYNGLIALNHEKSSKKGILHPEVKIEEIWGVIYAILKRNGYNYTRYCKCPESDFPRYLAYTYNFYSLGRSLYPGISNALESLKMSNIYLGIVSNAQFYTPIDITLMLRDQSVGKYDDYSEIFEGDMTFYSYEYGVAKPDQLLFRKLFDVLYEYHILPEQTVFIGNDLATDIQTAAEVGMKTAFFCGDRKSTFMSSLGGEVIPDITFTKWESLPEKLSFYDEGGNKCE
jgi:putative hydrolase of the HAD superfamily